MEIRLSQYSPWLEEASWLLTQSSQGHHMFMQRGKCYYEDEQARRVRWWTECSAGLIRLKAGDNWRWRGLSDRQSGRAAGPQEAFDLARAECWGRGGSQGEGAENVQFLAVIYSDKKGAVILSCKLESYYF